MRFVTLSFSEAEYQLLEDEAKLRAMPVATFVKHMALLKLSPKGNYSPDTLLTTAKNNMASVKIGEPFIVSALLPNDWHCLTRSQKMLISKQLLEWVSESNGAFEKLDTKYQSKTNMYIRIK